jgi:hypothetical protein
MARTSVYKPFAEQEGDGLTAVQTELTGSNALT